MGRGQRNLLSASALDSLLDLPTASREKPPWLQIAQPWVGSAEHAAFQRDWLARLDDDDLPLLIGAPGKTLVESDCPPGRVRTMLGYLIDGGLDQATYSYENARGTVSELQVVQHGSDMPILVFAEPGGHKIHLDAETVHQWRPRQTRYSPDTAIDFTWPDGDRLVADYESVTLHSEGRSVDVPGFTAAGLCVLLECVLDERAAQVASQLTQVTGDDGLQYGCLLRCRAFTEGVVGAHALRIAIESPDGATGHGLSLEQAKDILRAARQR